MYTSQAPYPLRLLPAIALLGLLGPLGASPAAAQKLTLGDTAGAGAAIISGAGTTASGSYSFFGGAGADTHSYDEVDVGDAPSALTLQAGGSINNLYDGGGPITILGGSVQYAQDENGTILKIQGGSVQSLVSMNGGSDIQIQGGTVGAGVSAFQGAVHVSGGTVMLVRAAHDGDAFVSGGTVQKAACDVGRLHVGGGNVGIVENEDFGSVADISGGTIKTFQNDFGGQVGITGGKFQFVNNGQGEVDIFGTNLTATHISGTGDFNALLTGVLQNGDILHTLYRGSGGAETLYFNGQLATLSAPVPETSSVVSLGLLLSLGLVGRAVGRRRLPA